VNANSPPRQDSVPARAEKKISSLNLASPSSPVLSEAQNHSPTFATWINRVVILLLVSVCAVFGVLLVILPWTPKWTDNYLLISYPSLRDFLENGFVRGMCTGLGALDVWIGFWEAMHYHEKDNRP
jgi:hypothetical protein